MNDEATICEAWHFVRDDIKGQVLPISLTGPSIAARVEQATAPGIAVVTKLPTTFAQWKPPTPNCYDAGAPIDFIAPSRR